MKNTIQLYTDESKTVKGYPITSPDRVLYGDGKSIKDKLKKTVKFDVVGEGEIIPPIEGEIDKIKEQVDSINEQLDNINNQLDNIENVLNLKIEMFKRLDNEEDDTNRIKRAIEKGGEYLNSEQSGELGIWSYNVVNIIFDSRIRYVISEDIVIPFGLNIIGYGNVKVIAKNRTCSFLLANKRANVDNFSFINFGTVFKLSGGNVDVSMLNITNVTFNDNYIAIDGISREISESMIINISKCIISETKVFIKNYSDECYISNSWLYHLGYNNAFIENYNQLRLRDCLCVPLNRNQGNEICWISNNDDNYLHKPEVHVNNCRLGAEGGGGIPLIINNCGPSITFDSCTGVNFYIEGCEASSVRSLIILNKLCNNISIKNCSNLYDMTQGIVRTSLNDSDINLDIEFMTIDIDKKIMTNNAYLFIDTRLEKYLIENKPFRNFNKNKYHNTLIDINSTRIQNGTEKLIYTIGLTGGYPACLIELNIRCYSSIYTGYYAKYVGLAKNQTTGNCCTSISEFTKTILFEDIDKTTQLDVVGKIENGKLNIYLKNNGLYSLGAFIKGNIDFIYLDVNNTSVPFNQIPYHD